MVGQLPLLESRGLQLAREGRRVWPMDGGPADVLRRVPVGVGGEPTGDTEERGWGRPMGRLTVSTTRAGLAGGGRMDGDHRGTPASAALSARKARRWANAHRCR